MTGEKNSVVYDLLLMEADRFVSKKREDKVIYHKDKHGDFIPIAQG